MEITEVFYPTVRAEWRAWLETHHDSGKTEIWLRTFNKTSGKPTLQYDEIVEECLCFGWIDGAVKKYCDESKVQRMTPRRKKSFLSELNRQRIWKLQQLGLMTPAGIVPVKDQIGSPGDPLVIPAWVQEQLQADAAVWENFRAFPHFYQRLKVGWIIETGKLRMDEAQRRLDYLIRMTRQGKRYGTEPLKQLLY